MTQPGGEGGTPANSGEGDGGSGVVTTLYTQQQLDHTAAQARRGALGKFFTDLGMDKVPSPEEMKQIYASADEHRKQQDGQKGDVERLTGELATSNEKAAKVPGLEAQLLRAQLAGDAGLKSRYWKYVEGDNEEAIKASVNAVLADVGGGSGEGEEQSEQPEPGQQQSRTGTGSLAPNRQQGTSGGSSGQPKASLMSGREAYEAKHKKKE